MVCSIYNAQMCITANGNILSSGNISLKLIRAPLETIELLVFWYVVAKYHIAQLTFSWRRPLSYRNQSTDLLFDLIWFDQWTGFHTITDSVMKELKKVSKF